MKQTGVEAHSSLNIGERLHQTLRQAFRKLRLDHPKIGIRLLLSVAVKALNDTIGPDGVVPSALLFGEYPLIRTFDKPRMPNPKLVQRALIAQQARKLMAQNMAKARVTRAIKHNTLPADYAIYQPGDRVLVWREDTDFVATAQPKYRHAVCVSLF